jgi:biofilm PGA synthesis N-glycosyltransferase PgaC
MIPVTVLIPVHNEEQNVEQLLRRVVFDSNVAAPLDVIVIASGCTDRTVELSRAVQREAPSISVIEQAERAGKASAINLGLASAQHDVVVLISGDVLPEPHAIARLVARFDDPSVGAVGAHPVPLNDDETFVGFAVNALWRLHHLISLSAAEPKCGEMMAFRRRYSDGREIVASIPPDSAVDEASIQAQISAAGLRAVYEPEAVVHMWGPATFSDWYIQRRRINAGHILLSKEGYRPATMSVSRAFRAVLGDRQLMSKPPWLLGLVGLEASARFAGHLDVARRRSHTVWRRVASTKRGIEMEQA